MAEAVYNASGLGLPIVMTLGNRAIGAPINIWNDHSDAMSMRDAGWLQLFAETNQEAVDLHIQAFKLAEELSMPVMVCVDGFILTHAVERIDIPDQAQVDAYLPPYDPVQVLDPAEPASIGAMVGPEAFTEVRFLAHYKQTLALKLIPEFSEEFRKAFGRELRRIAAHLSRRGRRHAGGRDGLGVRHHQGHHRRDARGRHPHRPRRHRFLPAVPGRRVAQRACRRQGCRRGGEEHRGRHGRAARQQCRRRAAQPAESAAAALLGRWPRRPPDHPRLAATACSGRPACSPGKARNFLDLNERVVGREIHRTRKTRHSGPTAENILRQLAKSVAAGRRVRNTP